MLIIINNIKWRVATTTTTITTTTAAAKSHSLACSLSPIHHPDSFHTDSFLYTNYNRNDKIIKNHPLYYWRRLTCIWMKSGERKREFCDNLWVKYSAKIASNNWHIYIKVLIKRIYERWYSFEKQQFFLFTRFKGKYSELFTGTKRMSVRCVHRWFVRFAEIHPPNIPARILLKIPDFIAICSTHMTEVNVRTFISPLIQRGSLILRAKKVT